MFIKKTVVFSITLFLAVSTLTSINIIDITKASRSIIPEELPINYAYIRSNGDVDPITLPIERSGDIYVLKGNIENYTIAIEKEGIILDGNGHTLTLPAYGEIGEDGQVKSAPALVTIRNVTNITVKNLEFRNCATGISADYSSKITMLQNNITSDRGISLIKSNNCNVINNSINCTSIAIHLTYTDCLNITCNKLTYLGGSYSSYGISEYIHNSSIVGNVFSNFFIAMSHVGASNEIAWNTFENNDKAISISMAYENNEVHHNNFIDNGDSFSFSGRYNSLDDGKEGNYWSDYNGTDNDGDGIGDTPWVISSTTLTNNDINVDNYPLMTPVDIKGIPEFPSLIILPLFLSATMFAIIFKKKLASLIIR